MIPRPPTEFAGSFHGERWFHWNEVARCFWPGPGSRAMSVDPQLAPVRLLGGIYLLAHARRAPRVLGPAARQVRYIGQTNSFVRRLGQFRDSAGFVAPRRSGHSAAWRWTLGYDDMWLAFAIVGTDILSHLATGLRHWMEALAIEQHRQTYGSLPQFNRHEASSQSL